MFEYHPTDLRTNELIVEIDALLRLKALLCLVNLNPNWVILASSASDETRVDQAIMSRVATLRKASKQYHLDDLMSTSLKTLEDLRNRTNLEGSGPYAKLIFTGNVVGRYALEDI